MKRARNQPGGAAAFSLLELVIAIALLALITGMIFGVSNQYLRLGQATRDSQNEHSVEAAFFELLDSHFSSLPGNARIELTSTDSGQQYLSDLTVQNVPLTFSWGGGEQVARAVQLSTERRRDGFLDIVMRYYENPILEETSEIGESQTLADQEPFAEVTLLEDIYIFEWRVLDGRTMEWQYDWDLVGRVPLQLELTFVDDRASASEPIRQVFWITPKQDPEVMMRQLQQQAREGAGGGGGGPGGGDDDDDEEDPRGGGGNDQRGGDR